MSIEPATWERMPSSLYSSLKEIPDLPSFRELLTSLTFKPIGETAPIPVMTTLLGSI